MTEDNLLKVAEKIKDGKATKKEVLEFFKALNVALGDIKRLVKISKSR